MLKIAALASCEAAVKILAYQGIRVCGDTLLNMLKAAGNKYKNSSGVVRKIGVDDWAYRKGQRYGTLICDLATHEIIDVLESRDSEVFENWLRWYPDISIVSRDRASAYASAVSNVDCTCAVSGEHQTEQEECHLFAGDIVVRRKFCFRSSYDYADVAQYVDLLLINVLAVDIVI